MPLTDACKSHRLPAPQAFSRGKASCVRSAKNRKRSYLKGYEKESFEESIIDFEHRTPYIYPQPHTVVAAEPEKEEIQFEPLRTAADVEVTDDAFECIELGSGVSSATLMELSLWETEMTARSSQVTVDVGVIRNALTALRSGIHPVGRGKKDLEEEVNSRLITQMEMMDDIITPKIKLEASVNKSDDDDDDAWLSHLWVRNKKGHIDEKDL